LAAWVTGGRWPREGWLASVEGTLAPGWSRLRSVPLTSEAAAVWAAATVQAWVDDGVYGPPVVAGPSDETGSASHAGAATDAEGQQDAGAAGAPGRWEVGETAEASSGEPSVGPARGGERPAEDAATYADGAGVSPGVWAPTEVSDVLAWADALASQPDVVALVARLGRRRGGAGPPPEGGREVVGVGLGRSVAQATPSALAMLGDPDFDAVFWRQLAEGRLLSWARGGDGEGGDAGRRERGPAWLALDTSASMAGARGLVARATALAVARHLRAEGRVVRLVAFGAQGESADRPLDDDPASWVRLLAWGFSGGTDLDGPVVRALTEHAQSDAGDLVLITDGEASLDPRTVAAAEAAHRDRGWSLELVLVSDGHLAIRSVLDPEISAC
jgi:hypothetical protein